MARFDLSDGEWALVKPLLPNKSRGVARVDGRRDPSPVDYDEALAAIGVAKGSWARFAPTSRSRSRTGTGAAGCIIWDTPLFFCRSYDRLGT